MSVWPMCVKLSANYLVHGLKFWITKPGWNFVILGQKKNKPSPPTPPQQKQISSQECSFINSKLQKFMFSFLPGWQTLTNPSLLSKKIEIKINIYRVQSFKSLLNMQGTAHKKCCVNLFQVVIYFLIIPPPHQWKIPWLFLPFSSCVKSFFFSFLLLILIFRNTGSKPFR